MPAARETLSLICFLGYALFFIEDRRWLMLATGVMTHLVIPTGGLWLLMWPAAVFLTFRPIPWARLFVAAGIVGVAGFISVILPKLIVLMGLPFPGNEFGSDNIITRLRFMTFADWSRFAFWAVPAGILPALFLLTWPKQNRIARALTLVTLGYFLFFYFQAYRVLLHHFIPAMIPPLVVMYRSDLWARYQPGLRIAAALLIALSVWLSWPREMKMHGFERVIGQHVATEGPIFDRAPRGDGDRFRGFDEKALDIAHVLFGNLFKMTYGEDDPKERYLRRAARLVVLFGVRQARGPGRQLRAETARSGDRGGRDALRRKGRLRALHPRHGAFTRRMRTPGFPSIPAPRSTSRPGR